MRVVKEFIETIDGDGAAVRIVKSTRYIIEASFRGNEEQEQSPELHTERGLRVTRRSETEFEVVDTGQKLRLP